MSKIRKIVSGLFSGLAVMAVPAAAFGAEESRGSLLREAGFNTVLGIGTVFIMLVVISLIIYCFKFIPIIQEKFSGKKVVVEEEPRKAVSAPMAAPVIDKKDDLELIAAIAAAIAASEQIPPDSFVVRTIKRRA